MLVPRWNILPDGLWEVVFAVLAVWFARMAMQPLRGHGIRRLSSVNVHQVSHYTIHLVMSCAMLYMYWLGMPGSRAEYDDGHRERSTVGRGRPSSHILPHRRARRVCHLAARLHRRVCLVPAGRSGRYIDQYRSGRRRTAGWQRDRAVSRTEVRGGLPHRHVSDDGLHAHLDGMRTAYTT